MMTATMCDREPLVPADAVAASPRVDEAGRFLADYTSWLWGCGASCVRIEKNVGRVAEAYGFRADLTLLTAHATVTLTTPEGRSANFTARSRHCGINYDLNTRLSALSWSIADSRVPYAEARRRFDAIVSRQYGGRVSIPLLTSLANASFCRLFGGDWAAMAAVFCATLAGYIVKQILIERHVDARVVFFVCAFISSALCCGASHFSWGDTPHIALATSVLYLIPGVPYLNAASDLIDRRYLCSFSRFMDAAVLTACLSAGMCLGIWVMRMNFIW